MVAQVLTLRPISSIKVDVMEIVPWRNGCPAKGSAHHHGNRQDAREGGEIPPLPRNCERSCQLARSIGQGREPARVFPPVAEAPCEPLQARPLRERLWEGGWKGASQETGPRAPNPLAFRGERRSFHALIFRNVPEFALLVHSHALCCPRVFALFPAFGRRCRFLPGCVHPRRGHGRFRRQGDRRECGSDQRRQSVATAVSMADGSFEINTGLEGRFFLVVSAKSFRQLETPGFYAGRLDSVERNVVLEPEWVRESIVVTATGTPTPQPQTSAATSVLAPLDLALRDDLVSALRLMPGTFAVQDGQMGAQTSLFVRGGDSDSNKILLDGVSVGDMGGQFDFGTLSTTAIERAEVYRGPDSSLYGADAASGVVSLTTPHGTTSYPSVLFQGDAGNLNTSREELEVAGAHNKLDYLGAFSWLQTANNLPNDEYHVATTAANLGWQLNGNTQIRGTLHYGVDATGVPNAWDFYHVADDRKEGDQDLYVGGTLENQTTPDFHNRLQYGLTRKREQSRQWYPAGICIPTGSCDGAADGYSGGNYYGLAVTIQGANGYSATGPALLNYSEAWGSVYPNRLDLINNRDQFLYQGDYRLTPHLMLLAGFHYENERAAEREPVYLLDEKADRTNYDYVFGAHGDFFKNRLFYTLGAAVEHYQLIGNGVSPHVGLGFYAVRPRQGFFSGTRLNGSFSQGVREPKLDR
jgi:vitamin B12 transporter